MRYSWTTLGRIDRILNAPRLACASHLRSQTKLLKRLDLRRKIENYSRDILRPSSHGLAPAVLSVWRIRIRSVRAGAAEGSDPNRVPDQSLAILAMLLERPGELVTREAIQARLWPNGTVVEFEHSVNSAVNRLRQACGHCDHAALC